MSGYSGRNRPPTNGGPQGVQRSYASQLREQDALFNTYEHLAGLPRGDSALKMLRQVASLVKPIMRKRGWKVQILAEFLPPEANLLGLNINRGHKICIRLRYHNNPDLFLPLEQVVDTMLHELSHNVWGEHDGNFHRLWDELRDEWETLTRKGYTGEGFLTEGKRLGGGRAPPPPHEMRRLARASAEKRQAQNKLTKGSGQRLGGAPLHTMGGDVRQVIADQVSRRNTINKGCASGRQDAIRLSDQSAINTFKTKAEEDDANNRAIAQALYELIEEEEDKKLKGTFSAAPTDGGLAWHPEGGLYDPRSEQIPQTNGSHQSHPSEEQQMEWAIQESMRHTPPILTKGPSMPPPRRNASNQIDRKDTSSAPPDVPTWSKPSPVSAVSPKGQAQSEHAEFSPISPLSPERHPNPLRSNPRASIASTLSSTSTGFTSHALPNGTSTLTPTAAAASLAHTQTQRQQPQTQQRMETSPVIDISDPFDPTSIPATQWSCEICTCVNPLQFLACDACGTERSQNVGVGNRGARSRPQPAVSTEPRPGAQDWLGERTTGNRSLGWVCRCGSFMEHRWWTCSSCGRMKESS